MKKTIALLLSLVMALCVVGCAATSPAEAAPEDIQIEGPAAEAPAVAEQSPAEVASTVEKKTEIEDKTMDLSRLYKLDEGERPLDRMVQDGGLCGIFRRIGCIGDSLSSGEFEAIDPIGTVSYHDHYEYSWGQFLARDAGCTVVNYSIGGMTAEAFWNYFGEECDCWNPDALCQAYIVALGVNDLLNQHQEIGTLDDVDFTDESNCEDSFIGYYARILLRLQKLQPDGFFFLMTMPRLESDSKEVLETKEAAAAILHELAAKLPHCYVIDMYQDAPVYDKEFCDALYLRGHLNPAGYRITAWIVESYIDYLIRRDIQQFAKIGFVGPSGNELIQ